MDPSCNTANAEPPIASVPLVEVDTTLALGRQEAIVLAVFGFIPGFFVSMGLYAGLVAVTGLPVTMEASRAILVFFGTLTACTLSGAIEWRIAGHHNQRRV